MAQRSELASTWGGPAEMSAWEAVMWRAEGDPRTRSTGVLLEVLAGEPDWDRLFAAHERITRQIPRLRERVVEPLLPLVTPAWSPDPHFDLAYHVQHLQLPVPGSWRQLLDLVAAIESRPLDRNRPPWEAVLITGLDGGRAAYALKVHHSLSDGLGLLQLLDIAHSRSPEPSTNAESDVGDLPAVRGQLSPAGLLTDRLRAGLASAPADLERAAGTALSQVGQAVRDPVGSARRVLRFGASLRRMLTPPAAKRSPLLRDGGFGYRLVAHDVALTDLKRAGKAAGGSVNDAFLAAVLGTFRRYHERHGVEVDYLPLSVPISLRSGDDPLGGNRFAGVRFDAPVGEPDPAARIASIRDFIVNARAEPAIGFLDLITPVLSRLPSTVLTQVAGGMTNVSDVQASNIPGLGHPVYLAGAKVDRMYPMGPRPGVAAMVTVVSYDGTCCIGVNLDSDVFSDVAVFEDCLRGGFDEVIALADAVPDPPSAPARQAAGRR
jgi:WS/DGAT/MGAT family acyltransferase